MARATPSALQLKVQKPSNATRCTALMKTMLDQSGARSSKVAAISLSNKVNLSILCGTGGAGLCKGKVKAGSGLEVPNLGGRSFTVVCLGLEGKMALRSSLRVIPGCCLLALVSSA